MAVHITARATCYPSSSPQHHSACQLDLQLQSPLTTLSTGTLQVLAWNPCIVLWQLLKLQVTRMNFTTSSTRIPWTHSWVALSFTILPTAIALISPHLMDPLFTSTARNTRFRRPPSPAICTAMVLRTSSNRLHRNILRRHFSVRTPPLLRSRFPLHRRSRLSHHSSLHNSTAFPIIPIAILATAKVPKTAARRPLQLASMTLPNLMNVLPPLRRLPIRSDPPHHLWILLLAERRFSISQQR